uniref:Uncharacterized protein n=1 Tax=Strigamia maritima TaxID=126957 RepID=T1IJC4_STRMM
MAYDMDRIPKTTVFKTGDGTVGEAELISGSWWQHLIAGGCAGAVSRTLTAPLDRIKVFLQVHPNHQFQGIASCVKHMHREGGFQSFWRGNGINVLKITPESALKFMAYDQVKRLIRESKSRELMIQERFIAGSVAGGVSQSLIYPLEVLKTRLALRKTGEFNGIQHALVTIYRNEGIKSFYRGYLPNLLGIIPYAGIELAVYETLKKSYLLRRKDYHHTQPPVFLVLWCGTVSCTAGQLVTYPLALVRTKLQAKAIIPTLMSSSTMVGTFRTTLQDEGFRGLYRGIFPNLLKVIPTIKEQLPDIMDTANIYIHKQFLQASPKEVSQYCLEVIKVMRLFPNAWMKTGLNLVTIAVGVVKVIEHWFKNHQKEHYTFVINKTNQDFSGDGKIETDVPPDLQE